MAPRNQTNQHPQPIRSAKWMKIVGAVFAAILLIAFLGLGAFAAVQPGTVAFDCVVFSFMAGAFAIGGAASASFLGGGAAIDGDLGLSAKEKPLRFSMYGGVSVLVIVFMVFFALKPNDCGSSGGEIAQLRFEPIPAGFRGAASDEFWVRHQGMSDTTGSHMTVRIGKRPIDQGTIRITQDGNSICEMKLNVVADIPTSDKAYFYHKLGGPGSPFKISVSIDAQRAREQLPQNCFSRDEKVIPDSAHLGLAEPWFRFEKPLSLNQDEGFFELGYLDIGPHSPVNDLWSPFRNIGAAFAQSTTGSFADLQVGLASPNPDLRIDSRRQLGANFSTYALQVLEDLSSPEFQDKPDYLTSLLHGLNDGIRTEYPQLKPASGRDLSQSLPYLGEADLERIFELSGHPDPSVRKQARRFMQTFPIDAIEPEVAIIVSNLQDECRSEQAGWQSYAAVFFYYNRLIQEGLNTQIDQDRALFWDTTADTVQTAVENCIDEGYRVDAALLDYGRATTYGWSSVLDESASKQAAEDFLELVGPQTPDYYMSRHVSAMKAAAGG